jgi:hypothetical protein
MPAREALRRVAAGCVALVATLGLVELGACGLVEVGLVAAPAPAGSDTGVWWGGHPSFGVWHRPGTSGEVAGACYRSTYRINSVGARDVERPRSALGPRVVVLGDSFLEGWGLPMADRLSNLLETATGIPHLNFAMAHFGPYQQLLAYEQLASRFDHSAVLASVLPNNDFVDLDLESAREFEDYAYRYRPYLVGELSDLVHVDYREPPLRRLLRHHSYAFHAARRALRRRSVRTKPRNDPLTHSWFYDASERQLALLDVVLERLARRAGDRLVAVVLIPVEADMRRYARDGPSPLAERLRRLAEGSNLRIVDLLPYMAERYRTWSAYQLECDYHWSRFGNTVAFEYVLGTLGREFYGTADDPSRLPPD